MAPPVFVPLWSIWGGIGLDYIKNNHVNGKLVKFQASHDNVDPLNIHISKPWFLKFEGWKPRMMPWYKLQWPRMIIAIM